MRSKQYFSRTKNNPHEKSTEPKTDAVVVVVMVAVFVSFFVKSKPIFFGSLNYVCIFAA